ncbi:serine/threonine protein kinase [Candidatus Poribacteria bacterium]|nr:serine/threonine protein kinase [Candidatus Poribacteria bacterium]
MKINELILGKYRLLEYLSGGSFSSVFRAREEMTNRIVAIKALSKDAYPEDRIRYLLTELQAMSNISGHPNIVSIHTVEPGSDNCLAWIVMEYIEGMNLHKLVQQGALTLNEVVNIGVDICNGLKAAHAQNILHRDIKPQNILLTKEKKAKIADFSIARIFGDSTEFAVTMTGTRRYMAPEQHYGAYDYRADLYATGLVLYEALTKQFPFSGDADVIDKKKASGEIENLDKCPEEFRHFTLKALHRDVEKRYQTAAEMYDELDRIRRWQYEQQASVLIAQSSNSPETELASALERCRNTFRLEIDIAERINQNLFFEKRNRAEKDNRERLKIRLRQHYSDAVGFAHNNDLENTLNEINKAHNLSLQDNDLVEQADSLFREMGEIIPKKAGLTVYDIAEIITELSEPEKDTLHDLLSIPNSHKNIQPEDETDSEYEEVISNEEFNNQHNTVLPVQPASNYRALIEEASPEFLLDKVHEDIQYPHEEEAANIYQQAQIYTQQDNMKKCIIQYKRLGAFYYRYARRFIRMDEIELVANCYTRARFAYAAARKLRDAKKNARNGGAYYLHLARQLEMQRAWFEAGKSYILAADNYHYAQQPIEVEKCESAATVCYFNAAESAHVKGELQTAYDFYMLILSIGEKLENPTKAVIEAQKLVDIIWNQSNEYYKE